MQLAAHTGRQRAHHLIQLACRQAIEHDRGLLDALKSQEALPEDS